MPVSSNYRNIKNNESLVYISLIKSFRKASLFLEENVKDLYINHVYDICVEYEILSSSLNLYTKRTAEIWMKEFWVWLWVYDVIDHVGKQVQKACLKWYQKRVRLFDDIITRTWVIVNPDIWKDYLELWRNLELSNYRGTITHTTKYNVISILKNWVDKWLSVWEVQKQISSLSSKLFSKARARSIAVTEMWRAYEYGNYQPIRQLSDAWVAIRKYWLTCRDNKVRPEHRECEELWWVDLDYVYPSVWVPIPPWWVNCRCTIEYDFDL